MIRRQDPERASDQRSYQTENVVASLVAMSSCRHNDTPVRGFILLRLGEILGEVKRPVTLIPTVGRDAPLVVERQPA